MIRLLRYIKHTPERLKRRYNYCKFKKFSQFGKNLELNSRSDCVADKSGTIKIGDNCRIFCRLLTQDDGNIIIGNNTCMYERTFIGSVNKITIGNGVIISNHVHIFDNNNHPTSPEARKRMVESGFDGELWRWKYADSAPVIIEDNVWIGEYSAIMKGVHIGKGSIVAAHSVVTKDVPDYSIVAGNPARVVKRLESEQ